MTELTVIQQLIGSLGFPIFVAAYLLIKDSADKKLMTESLNQLQQAIISLRDMIQNQSK